MRIPSWSEEAMPRAIVRENIGACRDLEVLNAEVSRFALDLGYRTHSLTGVTDHPDRESGFRTVASIPEGFREHFQSRAIARVDPVMQHSKKRMTPLMWDQSTYIQRGQGEIWEEIASFGLVSGVAMALHLPGGRHIFIGLDRPEPAPAGAEERQATMAKLNLFASYAAEPTLELLTDPPRETVQAKLSDQELECLRWRGAGKSAWETGRILNVSESRVNQICAAVNRKLGCVNTSQAALRALRLGFIN
jgi:DNA-binding CsgD family transcriptional regulator